MLAGYVANEFYKLTLDSRISSNRPFLAQASHRGHEPQPVLHARARSKQVCSVIENVVYKTEFEKLRRNLRKGILKGIYWILSRLRVGILYGFFVFLMLCFFYYSSVVSMPSPAPGNCPRNAPVASFSSLGPCSAANELPAFKA